MDNTYRECKVASCLYNIQLNGGLCTLSEIKINDDFSCGSYRFNAHNIKTPYDMLKEKGGRGEDG